MASPPKTNAAGFLASRIDQNSLVSSWLLQDPMAIRLGIIIVIDEPVQILETDSIGCELDVAWEHLTAFRHHLRFDKSFDTFPADRFGLQFCEANLNFRRIFVRPACTVDGRRVPVRDLSHRIIQSLSIGL